MGRNGRKSAYRWSQEVTAIGKLNNEELEMAYKIGQKPTDYLTHNPNPTEVIEIDIDGRTSWVRPLGS